MNRLLARPKLEDHPFVAGAGGDFISELARFNEEIEFKAGDVFFHEGDYADKFYLILEGKVSIEAEMSSGQKSVAIQTVDAGDALGWSWLFPPYTWHFSARACTDGKAIVLEAPNLMVHAENDPAFGYELMKRLSREVIRRLQHTRKLLLLNVRDRRQDAAEYLHSNLQSSTFPDRVCGCRQNKE